MKADIPGWLQQGFGGIGVIIIAFVDNCFLGIAFEI